MDVAEPRKSGINRDFAEAVWNCFKTEGVDLRAIPSIECQRVFVQDVAGSREKAEVDTSNAEHE